MIISLINHSKIEDAEVQGVLRAINRQIEGDFAPYWSMSAELRLEGRSTAQPGKQKLEDMRGDAVLYLWDGSDVDGALGYHDRNFRGIPYGFVFTKLAEELDEPWSVTLSHEALELIADPEVNLLAQGPHPEEPDRFVFFWYEMCDAVQAETYEIDHVAVSNFVLPLYFTETDEAGGRNDFLGTKTSKGTLRSFGVNPGGYIGFYDPELGDHTTYSRKGDAVAARRAAAKASVQAGRRSTRYKVFAGNRNPRMALSRARKLARREAAEARSAARSAAPKAAAKARPRKRAAGRKHKK